MFIGTTIIYYLQIMSNNSWQHGIYLLESVGLGGLIGYFGAKCFSSKIANPDVFKLICSVTMGSNALKFYSNYCPCINYQSVMQSSAIITLVGTIMYKKYAKKYAKKNEIDTTITNLIDFQTDMIDNQSNTNIIDYSTSPSYSQKIPYNILTNIKVYEKFIKDNGLMIIIMISNTIMVFQLERIKNLLDR